MGTTTSTNLGLIKPDTNESIKEDLPTFVGWASQYSDNLDTIDDLFDNSFNSYTPAWACSTTNPVLGAGGSIDGRYLRLFPKLVIAHFTIDVGGAGFSAGTGSPYTFTLPVAMNAEIDSLDSSVPVGMAYLHDDSSVANTTAMTIEYSTVSDVLFFRPTVNGVWHPTNPFTLAQNDKVSGYFIYPTDVA